MMTVTDDFIGRELWSFDGTAISLLVDISPDDSSCVRPFTEDKGELFSLLITKRLKGTYGSLMVQKFR